MIPKHTVNTRECHFGSKIDFKYTDQCVATMRLSHHQHAKGLFGSDPRVVTQVSAVHVIQQLRTTSFLHILPCELEGSRLIPYFGLLTSGAVTY